MSEGSLREILSRIEDEVKRKDEARQEIQVAMRKATRLSKQAIFLVHKELLEEAEKKLEEARSLFKILHETIREYPDLVYSGVVDGAYQEFSEASIFLTLIRDGRFISYEEINVPSVPYVLGLADVIGELRRRVLDLIRKGDTKTAEKTLELMEVIYLELMGLGEAYFLIQGLRKKCDVARRIIETTRGDLTIEVRRSSLESSINELKNMISGGERSGRDTST